MSLPRFKGIPRTTTTRKTTEHRFEFGVVEVRKLLRLPDDAQITVEHFTGDPAEGPKQVLTMDTGHVVLVATVTRTS